MSKDTFSHGAVHIKEFLLLTISESRSLNDALLRRKFVKVCNDSIRNLSSYVSERQLCHMEAAPNYLCTKSFIEAVHF